MHCERGRTCMSSEVLKRLGGVGVLLSSNHARWFCGSCLAQIRLLIDAHPKLFIRLLYVAASACIVMRI
jgi:hypothetical protein